jgi:hypothetical protein
VIDLEGMLKAKRTAGTHVVDPTLDLVGLGLVTFIAQ